ncbi:aminopeptidase [Wenjunlia vitaminophila]|uniref:Aminopeptidase N n=1 Tax=Wenjunlia vitaminophila TaxID=76728 RepID=A0A0T6LJY1_WENVI|nr:aminopeptidase N [Wenjunlia vitaminophila]KRV46362.1 aminopeptidase [Wenjunlia vitaminophila]
MPGQNLTIDEARTRSRLISVDGYRVDLDLRSAARPTTDGSTGTFRSVTTVRFRCAEPGATTFLDLLAPAVHSVTLNGRAVDPGTAFDGSRVTLTGLAEENEVTVDAECAYSRTGEGLHRFHDPVDDTTYLYTQYEPADARRVFANFEQPDLKAPYTFQVTAPAHWTVLSNESPTGDPQPVDDTSATWRFAPTKPISTYITAVVAGPYHQVRDEYRRTLEDGTCLTIPLGALCRSSLAEYFDADEIFTVTKQGLDFFHDHFDYPYPFGKYDQAFVPEYNLGAMENPGLVTFREDFVFRGKVTEASYEGRACVVLHEMAHMWFGDLVTMEWWDDLWLKESFADYMGSLALVEATRYRDGWITFANRRKSWAYRQDQYPTTHPITADIRDLEDAKLNFDGITYSKGASVLKQLVAYVGQDAFLEGARRYFRRHAYGNTTLRDLLEVLQETSGRDMASWSRAWLQTAGVNVLTPRATHDEDGRISELTVVQEPAPDGTLRPHRIAVGLYRKGDDGLLRRAERVEADITGATTVVPGLAGAARPDLILLNDEDLTYCKVRLDQDSLATLHAHLGDVADPLARALCWSAVWNLTRDGLLPARTYLDLVLRFAGQETDIGVLQSLQQQARLTVERYADPDWRPRGRRLLAEGALRELRAAEPGSGHQLAWARCFAQVAADEAELGLLRELLDGTSVLEGLAIDQELRWAFLEPLAAHGVADADALEAELRRDDTASGRRHQARCLAARPDAAVKAQAWRDVVESEALPNAMVDAVIAGFGQPGQEELLAPYTTRYFEVIEEVWATRSIEIAMRIVSGLYPASQVSPETLRRTDAWLAQAPDVPALRRLVLEARDELSRALDARANDRDGGAAPGPGVAADTAS